MALSFSIENILARPTYRRIKPAVRVQPYPAVYIMASPECAVNAGMPAIPPYSTTRKRRKRYRTIFTETQIALLEELYRTTPYPDLYQRESVAFQAGLQEERVEVWFKNRRARTRKIKRTAKEEVDDKKDEKSNEDGEKCVEEAEVKVS